MSEVKKIDGHARTVRQLLDNSRYTIDFYQREYAWKERQVRELMDDLSGKFLDFYTPSHARHEVADYGHYFLGSVVISHKQGKKFIVDGQQRLTTLTLLLTHLYHLQKDREDKVELNSLIFSTKFGLKSFNLDVEDRADCMAKIFDGSAFDPSGASASVRNIVARYRDVVDYFPEELRDDALPYFVDWLLENVHLVEIEAYSDEDAYTIFETMNDRGLSLSYPEMLKGYVLANIMLEDHQRKVNSLWKQHMQDLGELGKDEAVDFFKNWLRARHAETIRAGKKGAENKDYERIGSEFHRWVRDQKGKLGLETSDDFVQFVERDLDFYAKQVKLIRGAAATLTDGLESVRFNEGRGFTMQTQALLAPLSPDDAPGDIRKKMALVSDYLDIWLARRVWSFRTIGQSATRNTIFGLTRNLRDKPIPALSAYLRQLLDEEKETFARTLDFQLHHQNYRQVRHILARLTYWVDRECGMATHFEDLVSQGKGRPFEIEHIWPNQFEKFSEWFSHPKDFEAGRNRIGGLVLLQRGHNQSLGDLAYEQKRNAYLSHGQNLLTQSLHPQAYENNPAFKKLIDRTGLAFRHYEHFDRDAQAERQELYIRIAEWVWNPSRLDLDGVKPPSPEPLEDPEDKTTTNVPKRDIHKTRLRFWAGLLEVAKAQGSIHAHISPKEFYWIGTRKHGMWWNYAVLQTRMRAELYIDNAEKAENKRLFDVLLAQRSDVEADFGGKLDWHRMNDKRASRIAIELEGGWAAESTWERVHREAVDAMARLYKALAQRAKEAS